MTLKELLAGLTAGQEHIPLFYRDAEYGDTEVTKVITTVACTIRTTSRLYKKRQLVLLKEDAMPMLESGNWELVSEQSVLLLE